MFCLLPMKSFADLAVPARCGEPPPYGLKPDMITCAKALSSGYMPIGAVMVSEAIYGALVKQSEKIGVFSHGFTYSGHPVTSAVALETLKIYEAGRHLSHVRRMAPRMQAGFAGLRIIRWSVRFGESG